MCPVVQDGWWPRTPTTPYIDETEMWRAYQELEAFEYTESDEFDHSKHLSEHGFGKHGLAKLLADARE